jgi:hypothetical protein
MLAPETSGHAMGAEPVSLEPGVGNGATGGPTTATSLSSDESTHLRAALIDGNGTGQALKTSGCPFDADGERMILVEHTQFVQSDDTKTRLDAPTDENGAASAASQEPPVSQLHPTAAAEDRFVFDKPAPFDSGKGSAPARESVATKDGSPATSPIVDHSFHSGTGPIETSHHENQLLEHHHRDPTGENDLPRVASVRLGDSFHFKQPAPDGSGVLAPEPRHAAAEPYATKYGALHDHRSEHGAGWDDPSDPSGHHEHAGVIHGFGAAPMPELSPPHIDPAHGAGSTHTHVPHDLIV